MAKHIASACLTLLSLQFLTPSSWAQLDPHALNELFDDIPSLGAYHSMVHDEPEEAKPETGSAHLRNLRMLFRFANLKNTPIDDVLKNGGVDMSEIMDLNFNTILDLIETDRDFRWSLFDDLTAEGEKMTNFLDFIGTDLSDRFPILARDTSTFDEDYLECYKDYSSLAEYRTYAILERVGRSLLTDLIADVESQQEFCDSACKFVCSVAEAAPPVGCEPGCGAVCNGVDYNGTANATAVVEAILDYFIPEVEQYAWAVDMVDAMAKIPSGLNDANLMWTGSYYMCNDWVDGEFYNYTNTTSGARELREVYGKYCRLPFKPPAFNGSDFLFLYFGACVPSTCTKQHIYDYIYRDNLVFKLLMKRLEWDMDPDLIFCDHETDLATDGSAIACLVVMGILLVINIVASVYDVQFRVPKIQKQLEKEAGEIAKRQTSNGYLQSNPTYALPKKTTVNGVGGYNHVDEEEFNRYSRMGNFSNNNNQVGTDNGNNNNSGNPVLQHSISTSSTRPLYESYMSTESMVVKDEPPTWQDRLEVAFVGFSSYTNICNVFKVDKPEGYIETLDFMRFFSFMWMLFGHTWLFGPLYNESWCTGNLISSLYHFPGQFLFQPIINFHLSADTFFVISGLLTTYNWLRKYDQRGEQLTWKGVVGFYLRRYWSLIPGLMMVLMFYAAMYKYVSGGPIAPIKVGDAENCKINWWTDLFMLHNLVNTEEMCLSWTWYVACVFQLHIIAPLILIPLIMFPIAGYAILALLYIIHIGATAGVSSMIWDAQDVGMWFEDYLVTPWCRAGPYFIGMALGIFLYEKKLKVEIKYKWLQKLTSLFALFLLFAPAYGTYTRFNDGILSAEWSKPEQVMWDTFSRTSWALGVSWFILIGSTGNAGYLGDWMNHNMHQPFARMVYPSFLFHSLMVFGNVYSQHVVLYINWSKIIQTYLSNLCICLFTGVFFIGLLFHYPLSYGIIKAFSVRNKRECIEAGNHPPLPEPGFIMEDEPYSQIDTKQPAYLNGRNSKSKEAFVEPGTPKTTTKF